MSLPIIHAYTRTFSCEPMGLEDVRAFTQRADYLKSEEQIATGLTRKYQAVQIIPTVDSGGRVIYETEPHLAACPKEPRTTREQAIAVRTFLSIAVNLYAALRSGEPMGARILESFGVRVQSKGLKREFLEHYTSHGGRPYENSGLRLLSLSIRFPTGAYSEWLDQALRSNMLDAQVMQPQGRQGSAELVFQRSGGDLREASVNLLDLLLNAHLAEVRLTANGIGGAALAALHPLAGLWASLLDAEDGEPRTGFCSVCGNMYIDAESRGKPRKYCSTSCSRKHGRALHWLEAVEGGTSPQNASKEFSIGAKTAVAIGKRNGLLKPGIDYSGAREAER